MRLRRRREVAASIAQETPFTLAECEAALAEAADDEQLARAKLMARCALTERR